MNDTSHDEYRAKLHGKENGCREQRTPHPGREAHTEMDAERSTNMPHTWLLAVATIRVTSNAYL